MKFSKHLMTAAFAVVLTGGLGVSAYAGVIDQGDMTLDENTGYQWLDLSFTDGLSYDAAVGGVATTQFGGGWVVATRDEVLQLWENITGVTSWGFNSYANSSAAAYQVAALFGFTSEVSSSCCWHKNIIGYHSGSIGVDEVLAGLLGFQVNSSQIGRSWVFSADNQASKTYANPTAGTWLVRGDNIRPSGNIGVDAVPEPSALGLLGGGLMSLGLMTLGRRRREDNATASQQTCL